MKRRTKLTVAGVAAVVVVIGAGTGIGIAATGGDDEPLTGDALDQASTAALDYVGGGTVVETEVGDDGAAYGVEVRLDDGRQVEIALDEHFKVIGDETDDDGPHGEDQDGGTDD
jgi:hypothetical protein